MFWSASLFRTTPGQARSAQHTLKQAETIVVSLVSVCEFVWALRYHYDYPRGDIAAIRQLLTIRNLEIDLVGANAGLAMLESGADFADGVIAYHGLRLGEETFVSFDRKAVTLLKDQGQSASAQVAGPLLNSAISRTSDDSTTCDSCPHLPADDRSDYFRSLL